MLAKEGQERFFAAPASSDPWTPPESPTAAPIQSVQLAGEKTLARKKPWLRFNCRLNNASMTTLSSLRVLEPGWRGPDRIRSSLIRVEWLRLFEGTLVFVGLREHSWKTTCFCLGAG